VFEIEMLPARDGDCLRSFELLFMTSDLERNCFQISLMRRLVSRCRTRTGKFLKSAKRTDRPRWSESAQCDL